jgi:hypothetical protein
MRVKRHCFKKDFFNMRHLIYYEFIN